MALDNTGLRVYRRLLQKDFLCLLRSNGLIAGSLGFSLLVVVVSSFAFRHIGMSEKEMLAVTPGILWIAFLFSGVIALNYSFRHEYQNSALTGLCLAVTAPHRVYVSKFVSNLVYLGILQTVTICAHNLFFGVHLSSVLLKLFLLTFIVAFGFSAIGTLLAAMSVATKGRELVLPLLLFPICIPLVAGAVYVSRLLLEQGVIPWGSFWMLCILVFDLISITLGLLLFEYVVWE